MSAIIIIRKWMIREATWQTWDKKHTDEKWQVLSSVLSLLSCLEIFIFALGEFDLSTRESRPAAASG